MKKLLGNLASCAAVLALIVSTSFPAPALAQQTAKVVTSCGTATYTAGSTNYVTQDTTGAACGNASGGGGGGGVAGFTSEATATAGTAGTNQPAGIDTANKAQRTEICVPGSTTCLDLSGGTAGTPAGAVSSIQGVSGMIAVDTNIKQIAGATPSLTNPIWVANAEAADITGTFTNGTQTTSITNTNADGYAGGLISINGTYGTASGVFEASDDAGTTFYSVICARSDGSAQETGYTSLTNTNRQWSCPVGGNDSFRVRSTAVASGTVNVRLGVSAPPPEALGGATSGFTPSSATSTIAGTVATTASSGVALPAGANMWIVNTSGWGFYITFGTSSGMALATTAGQYVPAGTGMLLTPGAANGFYSTIVPGGSGAGSYSITGGAGNPVAAVALGGGATTNGNNTAVTFGSSALTAPIIAALGEVLTSSGSRIYGPVSAASIVGTTGGDASSSQDILFDGAAYQKARGDTTGAGTQPYGIPAQRWSYPAAAGGIVNTTTAVTIKTAAGGVLKNCIASLDISNGLLGAGGELVVRDGAGGTVLARVLLGTAASLGRTITFPAAICGTANTLMEVATLTASVTGAVYVNATGNVSP